MAGLTSRGICEVLEVQERMSKKNKPYKIVTLGNKETYFKGDFFLSDKANLSDLYLNAPIEVIFSHEVRGYDVSTTVVGFTPVK